MPRILLVEDEPAIADTLVYVLESECHAVSHALTGGDGLSMLGEYQFDLAILDVGLPDMTGFEVCRKIREKDHLPVLFLTARDSEIDRVLGSNSEVMIMSQSRFLHARSQRASGRF